MSSLDALALLHDPARRALYEFVVAQGRDVGRAEAAGAVGVQRTLAAFHLDKLVEAGLLETGSRRLSGRSGPGAGRPAKVYRRAGAEHSVALPPRDYRTAALLLAEAADEAGADLELQASARRLGERMAVTGGLIDVLRDRGYEPYREDDVIRLRNCPFQALAQDRPPLICGMNLALMEGLVSGDPGCSARMDPRPGECCVALTPGESKDNED